LPNGVTEIVYASNKNPRRVAVDVNGKFLATSTAFSSPANRSPYHDLKVAFSTASSGTFGLLIASTGRTDPEAGNCYCSDAQRLNSGGKPVSPFSSGTILAVPPTTIKTHGSLVIALPTNHSDKLHKFVWLQTLSDPGGVNGRILKVMGNFQIDGQP